MRTQDRSTCSSPRTAVSWRICSLLAKPGRWAWFNLSYKRSAENTCWLTVRGDQAGQLTTLKMVLIELATAIMIAVGGLGNSLHSDPEQNSLNTEEHQGDNGGGFPGHNWLKISAFPPTLVTVNAGTRIELECEAIGSPRPTIEWYRGRKPLQKETETNQVEDVSATSGNSGIGKMKSRLVLDCIMPQMEGSYTCVASSGSRTALAPSTMMLVEGSNSVDNLTTLLRGCQYSENLSSASARITMWSPVYMEMIGRDVVLPCRAEGHPVPSIYWMDNESQPITQSDRRFKVMTNGDLYISKLRWNDMGGYTCVATNSEARDAVTTFVYPVLNENS